MKIRLIAAVVAVVGLGGCAIPIPVTTPSTPVSAKSTPSAPSTPAVASSEPTSEETHPSQKIDYETPQDVFAALEVFGIDCDWTREETDPNVKFVYYTCEEYNTALAWAYRKDAGKQFVRFVKNEKQLKGYWYDQLDQGTMVVQSKADADALQSMLGGNVGEF